MKKIFKIAMLTIFATLFVSTVSFADINKPGSVGWKPPVRSQQKNISKAVDSNYRSCSCTSKQGSGNNETFTPCKAN